MRAIETQLDGPVLIEPTVHGDERGFFMETYRRSTFAELGIDGDFVQDNQSRSLEGVVRGIHFDVGEGQAKVVRCARGAIFDVVVDLRRGSPKFGRWEGHELSDANHRQLYVPPGFGHGFCVTSDIADVVYKLSAYYDPSTERGFAYDDSDVGIEWPAIGLTVSERDATAPALAEIAPGLPFTYP